MQKSLTNILATQIKRYMQGTIHHSLSSENKSSLTFENQSMFYITCNALHYI